MIKKIFNLVSRNALLSTLVAFFGIAIIAIIHNYLSPAVVPQYTISRIRQGSIIQTVTATGQVSAENQLDITSQVSGTILAINSNVGQHVTTGSLIAKIDPTNALNSLLSSQISLAKLTQVAKPTDITNAQNSVSQSYTTAINNINSTYIDMQTVLPGLNNLFYGKDTYLSDQSTTNINSTAQNYRLEAGVAYDKAKNMYDGIASEVNSLNHSSATSTIAKVLNDTIILAKLTSEAVQKTNTTIQFLISSQPQYQTSLANTSASSVKSWSSTTDGDLSSLVSNQNSIISAENTLSNLIIGADTLDVASAKLNLSQAQQTYNNYFIKAPFDGVIARIPVNVYQQAGNSTVMATIIGDQKIATLTLNEVDAAKVNAGNPVSITFNAINNFTATGTVQEIDQVGTVSSGVVSYGLKVLIGTTDNRIKPGMSVNATIITNEIDNVIIVPTTAIKAQGRNTVVQIFTANQVSSILAKMNQIQNPNSTTTGLYGTYNPRSASSTDSFASSTLATSTTNNNFGSNTQRQSGIVNRSVTISSLTPPTTMIITTDQTDNTNTEVTSGLNVGDWVITKTMTAPTTAPVTAAPSLLNSLGAGGRGGGTRPVTPVTTGR